MRYSLDANTVIALLKGHDRVWRNLERHSPLDCAISSVVMHELYFGAFRSARVHENLNRIASLRFTILDFGPEDARLSAEVRAQLARAGTPIGPLDTLIAGQALARQLRVVSRNSREFSRVSGLGQENWED
jgi:tRNA(fMet)-specific endonuclease VapC